MRAVAPVLDWLDGALAAQRYQSRPHRPGRAAHPGRDERHRAQHHHQHAPDLDDRLGRAVRAHQVLSMRCSPPTANSPAWISRPATPIAVRSRGSRAARTAPKSRWRHVRSMPRTGRHGELRAGRLSDRERDPGYYLIAKGREGFEQDIGFRPPRGEWLSRLSLGSRTAFYLGLIAFLTLAVAAVAVAGVAVTGVRGWPLVWLALLGIIPASDVAVASRQSHRLEPVWARHSAGNGFDRRRAEPSANAGRRCRSC